MPRFEEVSSFLEANRPKAIDAYFNLSSIAGQLADAFLLEGEGFRRDRVVDRFQSIALDLSGADVACCRVVVHEEQVDLIGEPRWAEGAPRVGTIPKRKHREDCRTRLTAVSGGPRTDEQNQGVIGRSNPDGSAYYTDDEIKHFLSLGSEAFIPLMVGSEVPKAILLLGHRDPDHFDAGVLARLEEVYGLFTALFQLADFAEDRYDKALLLQETAKVLPRMAQADSRQAFARAVCALLTCSRGFGFHRSLVFWMNNGELPAVCEMAVGGIGDAWPKQWNGMPERIGSRLVDWIQDALRNPLPQSLAGETDPLYSQACDRDGGLCFCGPESEPLAQFLKTGKGTNGGPALRLTHQDPWIAASHRTRDQMFFNRSDEFFVFQLRPVGVEGSERLMGFVIADIAYRPQKHMPGLGFPDLAVTAFALNLIAGLWHVRETAKSYFHLLGALPLLRHSGGRIVQAIDQFAEAAGQRHPTTAEVRVKKEQLLSVAHDLARAKEIVEEVRGHARDACIADLREFLRAFGNRVEGRYKGCLRWALVEPFPAVSVRVHPDDLESILFCLVDNAVKHGTRADQPTITCKVSAAEKGVPMGSGHGSRLLLQIENDGRGIGEDLVPFLFSDGVSTSIDDGHGTGLSSARQIAKAYGGDVIFVSADPARFGVVLEPT